MLTIKAKVAPAIQYVNQHIKHLMAAWMAAFVLVVGGAFPITTYAQTPVPLVVPVNDIFIQTNSWLAIFGPIIAIGVGIAVALAILTFVGNQIIKAFH